MKYRKIPVEIEAIQWKGENFIEIDDFITVYHETYPKDGYIIIPTLEGNMKANLYDYIIKGVNGEFYPCKPDIFEKTYEKVEEVPTKTKENESEEIKMLKMKYLEKCFESANLANSKFIGVLVEMRGFEKAELIVNKRENFDKKLEYYKNAYNDDLVLKTFDGIKIVAFIHANTLEELENIFNWR